MNVKELKEHLSQFADDTVICVQDCKVAYLLKEIRPYRAKSGNRLLFVANTNMHGSCTCCKTNASYIN